MSEKLRSVNAYGRDIRDSMTFYIPLYYDEVKESIEILNAEADAIATLSHEIADLKQQMTPTTATWALERWERIFGIVPDNNRPTSRRISEIKARIRGYGVITKEQFRSILDSYSERIEFREDFSEYTIAIFIPSSDVEPDIWYTSIQDLHVGDRIARWLNEPSVNLREFHEEIRTMIPAHLAIAYVIYEDNPPVIRFNSSEKINVPFLETSTMRFSEESTAHVVEYRTVDEFRVGMRIAKDFREVVF